MEILGTILWAIVVGAIIGALARLVVPGRNPIGLAMTILLGIVGAVVGAMIANAADLGGFLQFLIALAVAAVLVFLVTGAMRGRSRV